MKKIVLSLALVLLFAASGFSQKGKQVEVGLGGGFYSVWVQNMNAYGSKQFENYFPKFGGAGIFSLGYHFTENIAVRTELGLTSQGQKYDKIVQGGSEVDSERNLMLQYLNIPLFFKYAIGADNTRFRFMVGPHMGLLLKAEQEWTRQGEPWEEIRTNPVTEEEYDVAAEDITDRFNNTTFGITLDFGTDIGISDQFYLNAGMRLSYDFGDINADDWQISHFYDEDNQSRNFFGGITVGINYLIDVESYNQRSF